MSLSGVGPRVLRRTRVRAAASLYTGDDKPLVGFAISGPYLGASAHIADYFSNQYSTIGPWYHRYGFLNKTRSMGDPYAANIPLPATWEVSPQVASIIGVLDTFKLPALDKMVSTDLDKQNIRRCREAARNGDLARAQLFYRRLHCNPPAELVADLLSACAERGLLGDAVLLYTDAAKLGVPRTEAVFTELLAVCVSALHPARTVWTVREALTVARRAARQSALSPLPGAEADSKDKKDKDKTAPVVPISYDGVLRLALLAVRFLSTATLPRAAAAQGVVSVLMLLSSSGLISSPFVHSSSLQAARRRAAPGAVSTHWMPSSWDAATRSAVVQTVNTGLIMQRAAMHIPINMGIGLEASVVAPPAHPAVPTAFGRGNGMAHWIRRGLDARAMGLPQRLADDALFEVYSADRTSESARNAPSPVAEALIRETFASEPAVRLDPKTRYLDVYFDAIGLRNRSTVENVQPNRMPR